EPSPADVIVGATNLRDHVVIRTCNTTVQIAIGLAHWSLGTAGTVAEFAASLEGLFAGWFDDLAEYHRLLRAIRAAEETETATQRSEERQRARLNMILAVIAAVGFSGLGQIVQAGYGWHGTGPTVGILLVIAALAALVGVLAWQLRDRTPDDELPSAQPEK